MMTVDIVTIFPAMIEQPLAAGIVGRAIERGALDAPWYTKPRESPKPFGFYELVEVPGDLRYGNALLLDYSEGGNLGPERLLRDALVQVERDSQDLYLGYAWLALGAWVGVGYFALERWGKAPEKAPR